MDWKEILKSFKLIDFQAKINDFLKGGQIGVINQIRIENINLNIPQDTLEKLIEIKITDALEEAAKIETFKILEPLSPALSMLDESTSASMVASTMATNTIHIKVENGIKLTDEV